MSDALLRELQRDLGAIIEAHTAPARVIDFERYREDIIGFVLDVLRVDPDTLWAALRQYLQAVAQHRRVAAYGANGCSKTFADACIALWWCFCRDGLVVATSAREGQLKDSLMRDIRILFHRAMDLPGELYSLDLRVPGKPLTGIHCRAAGDTSRLRGEHAPNMLVMICEAQGVPPFVFEAAEMMAVGDSDRVTCSGNCDLGPTGEFYKRCRSPHWKAVRFNAEEHPNITEGRVVIPGGPTIQSINQRAGDYGVDSGFYVASVKGEFPVDALEGLVKVQWLDYAFANFERGAFLDAMSFGRLVLGVDVARSGADRTVVCMMQGPVVRDFLKWRGADLEVTAGRIIEIARQVGIRQYVKPNLARENALLRTELGRTLVLNPPGNPDPDIPHARRAVIRVDAGGLGSGPYDRLTHQKWPTEAFYGSSRPVGGDKEEARFHNRRAQSFWTLRKLLEEGRLALPPEHRDDLVRELTAISWAPTGAGKILIESKADIKVKLHGDSPDVADSLGMSVTPSGAADFSYQPPAFAVL